MVGVSAPCAVVEAAAAGHLEIFKMLIGGRACGADVTGGYPFGGGGEENGAVMLPVPKILGT